jgi:hypothetical protein
MNNYQPSTDEVIQAIHAESAALGIDPSVAGFALAFRADPDGSAVVMADMFRKMNTGNR